MGRRGPQRLPNKQLKNRGSPLAASRAKARRGRQQKAGVEPSAKPEPRDWKRILAQIPGYDPWKQAGDCRFDEEAADAAIDFFHNRLTHVKGAKAREPFILEEWEQAIIGNLFGWKRPDGMRRYREALVFVGRKNGKTPLAAGIILYLLFEDGEPGAEIYGGASEYKQASLVFAHARGMILNRGKQSGADWTFGGKVCHIFKGQSKSIELQDDLSIYRVISADSDSAHGFNAHGVVVDELHTQPNAELVDALVTSTAARRQPLIVYTTTSDFEREGSICNEKYDYACNVRDGIIEDPSFLPAIWEASRDDDWTSEATWAKANPNLGVSIPLEYLQRECRRAQESPRFENTFKRLHLNIRTEQSVRWLQMEKWDACAGEVDPEALKGKECFAALDLSSKRDLTALCLLFPLENGRYAALLHFWIPADTARERGRRDKVPYLLWAKQGFIEPTDGNVVDYEKVVARTLEYADKYRVQELAIDRFQAEHAMQLFARQGLEVVPFGQGFVSMSDPTKELERLILSGLLAHGGHPVLRWMARNVAVKQDEAGNLKPDKKKSSEKIDGIVATIMALGRAMVAEPASVYANRGILTL